MSGLSSYLPGLGEQQLEVMQPSVQIVDDQIRLEATLVTKGASIETGVPIKISARPNLVGDSKIMLEDLQVEGPDIIEPDKFAQFAQDLLNPLIDFARMDRRDHAFRLADLKVGGGGVTGDGKLLLVPKAVAGDELNLLKNRLKVFVLVFFIAPLLCSCAGNRTILSEERKHKSVTGSIAKNAVPARDALLIWFVKNDGDKITYEPVARSYQAGSG